MLKNELLKAIKETVSIEITEKDIAEVLSGLESVVKTAVLNDDKVVIPGICTVSSKVVPEKTGTVKFGANKGSTWVKPEHKEGKIKINSTLKNIFE